MMHMLYMCVYTLYSHICSCYKSKYIGYLFIFYRTSNVILQIKKDCITYCVSYNAK